MGKGFQNFMSKKDFHPSAWWNIKKVWEARQKEEMEKKRQEELKVQYDKEQEMLNNKALLGDEKAKMGLSFMYDAPAGMTKREEPKPEPKFEWQRKYHAPREEWAKNMEQVMDQPFGIAVRNVRCVRCHTWGHVNTDTECPLYGKSGNYEDPGYSNNPSDLIKNMRKGKGEGKDPLPDQKEEYKREEQRRKEIEEAEKKQRRKELMSSGDEDDEEEDEWVPADKTTLAESLREEHGMRLKGKVFAGIRETEQLANMGGVVPEKKEPENQMIQFFQGLSDKEKKKLMKKAMGVIDDDKKKKKKKKDKKEKKKKRKRSPSTSSSSSEDDRRANKKKVKTDDRRKEKEDSRRESRDHREESRHRKESRRRRSSSRSRSPRRR